ncbi:MAG: hypothetical protein V4467_01000 [Patescibacteria group bacterium]
MAIPFDSVFDKSPEQKRARVNPAGRQTQFSRAQVRKMVLSAGTFDRCLDLIDELCGQRRLELLLWSKAVSLATTPAHWAKLHFRAPTTKRTAFTLAHIGALPLEPEQWRDLVFKVGINRGPLGTLIYSKATDAQWRAWYKSFPEVSSARASLARFLGINLSEDAPEPPPRGRRISISRSDRVTKPKNNSPQEVHA